MQTYRLHMCPQRGGSSGHTTAGISHWLTALEGNLESADACAVATSLFVLWRLYYDKRISAMHCMVETLEATLCSAVLEEPGVLDPPLVLDLEAEADPWQVVIACAVTGRAVGDRKRLFGIHPITLLKTARGWMCGSRRGVSLLQALDRLVDLERHRLSASYFFPQWSHETDPVLATEVRAYGRGKITTLMKL